MFRPTDKIILMRSAALAAVMAATAGVPAFAQSANAAKDDVNTSASSLSEVVVTARKKSENLLDVPLAITAMPSVEIQKKGIDSLGAVAENTPSLTVSSFGASISNRSQQTVIVRGVVPGTSLVNTTTVFVNGAPLGGSGLVDGLGDLAQIEIIKGPQAAYFGRSTFGGAINLITKKPSNDWKLQLDGGYGGNNWTDDKITVEGPIIKDILTARVAYRYYHTDGPWKGPFDGYRYGEKESQNLMGEVNFTPFQGLEVRAFGAYIKQDDGVQPLQKFLLSDFNCRVPNGSLYYCGVAPILGTDRLGGNTAMPPGFINQLKSSVVRYKDIGLDHFGTAVDNKIGTLTADYEIPHTGGITVTSVTAYNKVFADSITDLTNQYSPVLSQRYPFDTFNFVEAFSQELRFTSSQDRKFRWAFGGNYYYTNRGQSNMGISPVSNAFLIFGASGVNRNRTRGVFGSVSWDIVPQFTVNVEARYQSDLSIGYTRTNVGGQAVEAKVPGAVDNTKEFTPRVILQYKFKPGQQIYVTYSKGVSPGTFNTGILNYNTKVQAYVLSQTGAGISAGPEYMQNYEIGYKGSLFDGRLQLDADVYFARWTDQLINQSITIADPAITGTVAPIIAATYSNNGDSDLKGIEGNAFWQVDDNLSVSLSGSINDSKINEYTDAYNAIQLGYTAATAPLNLYKGNQLPWYSKYSAQASVDYTHNVWNDVDGFAHVDYAYKSGVYESPANFARSTDSNKINVRVGLQRGPQKIEAFITNLTDDHAYTSFSPQNDVTPANGRNRLLYGSLPEPRRFGVRFHAEFQ